MLGHSPQIATNGLVLHYDLSNTKKSFKGKPTTNYVTNARAMTGWSNYSNGTPVSITTSLGTPGYGFYNAGSWNGISRGITIPSTGVYTFSAWIRYIGGSANNYGGCVYISGWGGGDSATHVNKSLVGEWQRVSLTLTCTNLSFAFYLISYGGTNGADNSSWEMTMPQAEQGSIATPFVDGTRSVTESLVDLTNKCTIDVTSATYDVSGNIVFGNGTALDAGTTTTFGNNGPFTASAWIKLNSLKNFSGIINKVISSRGGAYNFMCTAHNNGTLSFYNNAAWYYSNNVGLTTNTWYDVSFAYDGAGTLTYYVNGENAGTSACTWPETAGYKVFIGSWYSINNLYDLDGRIDNAKVYNRCLSATEVRQNFNALRGRYGI